MKILQAVKRMVILSIVVMSATACQFIAGNRAKTTGPSNPAEPQMTCHKDSSCPDGHHPDYHPDNSGTHESVIWESMSGNILSIVL